MVVVLVNVLVILNMVVLLVVGLVVIIIASAGHHHDGSDSKSNTNEGVGDVAIAHHGPRPSPITSPIQATMSAKLQCLPSNEYP